MCIVNGNRLSDILRKLGETNCLPLIWLKLLACMVLLVFAYMYEYKIHKHFKHKMFMF